MNFLYKFINLFFSKENKFKNLKAKQIMIHADKFDSHNLTLGNTFKVNQNIKIKLFNKKILNQNLTVVVTDNKGKTIGYITDKQLLVKL